MFYSHTFLAKKSPLGTVWIAAHLQHKLRKSHIAVTDIPSSVDYVMHPEVPIALRLSGHLLLGIVRIYSKKVDYLYHDCNDALTRVRTAFTEVNVNLQEDESIAPFHAVTLPETFDLDALDMEVVTFRAEGPDNHLNTYEQITLTGQVPGEGDSYVAFVISEDDRLSVSPGQDRSSNGVRSMEEDVLPPFPEEVALDFMPVDGGTGVREPGPSNQAEVPIQNLDMSDLHEEVPEIEVLRDGVHNFTPEGLPDLAGLDDHPIQDEQSSHTVHGRVSLSPIHEHISLSGGDFLPSQLPINPPSMPSSRALGDLDLGVPSGTALPDLELQPSPLAVEIARPRRRRKREQFFDKSLVLTNECMRKQLQDTSKLIRKSKRLPLSALDVWRCQRIKKIEDVFSKPLISGMCTNLQEAFKKHRISPMVSEVPLEAPLDAMNEHFPVDMPHIDEAPVGMPHIEQSPTGITHMEIEIEQSPTGMSHMEIEIEQPRFGGHADGSFHDFMPSPSGRDDATASLSSKIGMTSQTGKTLETEIPSLGTRASYESDFPRSGTLFSVLEEQHQPDFDDNVFPDIPDLQKSADIEDLNFLESDNTPLGHAEDSVHNLSARTRAVAQYLKGKSPAMSEDQPGKLSLNRMLEGKTRKHCARMFFETMVLKSCGLIDVEQEEAYGDINISLMPALSKANF